MKSNDIQNYYNDNKDSLNTFFKQTEKSIEGRICHSSVLLLKIICELSTIENYLEIGVHNGGSMALIIRNNNIKRLYGIDLFEDIYDEEKHLNKIKYDTYQYFKKDNISIEKTKNNLNNLNDSKELILIQGNSYFDETENKLKENIKGELDLIHIDGDHTEEGVKNDFDRFFKYLKKGKYLVFDDYHHHIIKKFVDNLISNEEVEMIGNFKFHHTAQQYLIKKV